MTTVPGALCIASPARQIMNATTLTAHAAAIIRRVYSTLPFPGVDRPVFIIGCGRSGTTILGESVSRHRHVTYLNEPRHLWFSAFPESDVWTSSARSRNGRLCFTEADAHNRRGKRLGRLFRLETLVTKRPILVEKLPINSFRLRFIHALFPDARFIHIYRNGLEVARSIEAFNARTDWFGADSYKWHLLADYARTRDDTRQLPELCTTAYEKGLLEWRLSTEAVVDFLGGLPESAFHETNYDDFIGDPVKTISEILAFIGADHDPNVEGFVANAVARKRDRLDAANLSEKERTIGGRLLPLSADPGTKLTRRRT
jgi:hypothetical protein